MKEERKSNPKNDLTNQKIGFLTPLYYIKGSKWHCKCDCGKEIDVSTRNLNSGHTKSCGCKKGDMIGSKLSIDMSAYEDDDIKVLEREGSSEINQSAKWRCICKHCGREFVTEGKHIREGVVKSCGCVHSRGEQKITKMLMDEGCTFSTQYTFPDLIGVNGGKLRFDFAVFSNNELDYLIEYNGLQHYKKPEGKWGLEWENLIENDRRKVEYCKEHSIPLKIIKYDQDFTILDLI
jgi:hypothetical protein